MSLDNIYTQFHQQLYRFILKKVDNEDDAKDLLQDAFVRIWQRIDSVKEEQKITSWIYQVTRNIIVDFYRQKRYTTEKVAISEEEEKEAIVGLEQCMDRFIGELPKAEREIFIASEIHQRKQKDLAASYNIPYSSLRSKVQRSRKKVKEMIQQCCHVQYDARGNVMDFSSRKKECSDKCGKVGF